MTAKEHDTALLWEAFNAGNDFGKIQECEDACETPSIKAKIHDLKMRRYHIEELKSEMI